MRRQLPLAICLLSGLYVLLQYFSPHPKLDFWKSTLLNWTIIIGIFAYALGIISLWMVHWPKLRRQAPGWGYSAVTVVSFLAMVLVAPHWDYFLSLLGFEYTPYHLIRWGRGEGTPFNWLYNNIQYPIQATMFALLAFYIASAAYRAFRIRSMLATILLVAAVIVMLGRVPLGNWLSGGWFGVWADWLLNYPNLAAKRAIAVGVGFGGAAIALKILIGIERSYLGGGER